MQREPARVLVIDDDEVVLVAVSDLLEEHGYQVYTQGSPIGATQVIVHERIDIVVIDVNLPEMQGDSVARLLRTWDRLNDLPVVMLSGAETSRLEQIQRELPGIQIVRKNAMQRELVRILHEALVGTREARTHRTSSGGPRGVPAGKAGRDVQSFFDELAPIDASNAGGACAGPTGRDLHCP